MQNYGVIIVHRAVQIVKKWSRLRPSNSLRPELSTKSVWTQKFRFAGVGSDLPVVTFARQTLKICTDDFNMQFDNEAVYEVVYFEVAGSGLPDSVNGPIFRGNAVDIEQG